MKFKLWLLSVFLFFGAHAANAQLFGYHGSVTFSSVTGSIFVTVSGPSYADCEANRAAVKSVYTPPAYTVIAETPCVPIIIDPDKLRLPERIPEFKFPWPGPVCLSCPYLREDLVELIYPVEHKRVFELMDKFGIHEYNRALEELNMQFDLEGFSNEMHQIEQMEQKLQH